MQQFSCTLSTEEFEVANAAVGKEAESAGILRSAFGEISAEEIVGRFSAAQHSLMARGLLKFENDAPVLNPSLITIVNGIYASSDITRASKTSPKGWEDILSTLNTPNGWLEQFTYNQYICQLRFPVEPGDIQSRFARFYAPVFEKSMQGQVVKLPPNFFDFTVEQRRDRRFLYERVFLASKNASASENFAVEMAAALWRGSVMRLQPSGETALFLIQGPKTLWKIAAESRSNDQIDLFAQAIDEAEFLKNMPMPV